ncbi:uncharacterized protein LOC109202575 isoform X2 [Oreochromis niloticus]|uniref:uncharacterized protein LOC109202575 isoform X2 n=1 Tax=Oreochromis niloticus TaxID=8128 RepID=UPI0009049FC3|nr:uncharacterized protein LOC109202575 isoform X2 [Oreochromis niloticus]
MTMAGPYWVSVAVVVLMIVTNGETVIDPNQLAPIVQEILNKYTPSYKGENNIMFPMFSVAVSVPYNEGKFDMSKVTDSGEAVRKKILNCDVYQSDRVVAATVLKWPNVLYQCPDGDVHWPEIWKRCRGKGRKTWAVVRDKCPENEIGMGEADHAEFRTLQHFELLLATITKSKTDLMVFYVRDSPCDRTCTNPGNDRRILESIKQIKKWKNNYVVVFSNIFRPDNNNNNRENELRESLERLGGAIADQGSKVKDKSSNGLQNIFRCYGQPQMKCISCNTNGAVAHKCVADG